MPRDNRDRQGNGKERPQNPEFKGFVDFTITDAEHEAFDEWLPTVEEHLFWKNLQTILDSGYKLGVSSDRVNDCYIAVLTCNQHGHPDAGWCLTARDGGVFGALMLLFWKHTELLSEQWNKNKGARGKRSFG